VIYNKTMNIKILLI